MIGIMAAVVADMYGELDQLCSRFDPNQALAAYLKRVELKTAPLFPPAVGPELCFGGASSSEAEAWPATG